MSNNGTRTLGFILLIVWGACFAIPRWVEALALFVVLPGMIFVGIIKSVFDGAK